MCEVRIVNITLDMPAKSMLSISGKDCNMYWLGEPEENEKNNMYLNYAEALRNLADIVEHWTEEE